MYMRACVGELLFPRQCPRGRVLESCSFLGSVRASVFDCGCSPVSVSSEVCLAVPTRWHCMSRSVTLLTRACYVSVKAGTVPVCPYIDISGLCRACVGRSSGTDPSCLMYIYWQCLEGVHVRPTCTVMPCS